MKVKLWRVVARMASCLVHSLIPVLMVLAPGCARGWHDPSKHNVQFVTVDDGVRLEVLDWSGSGRPIVLLTGSGNTAHVYDDFAPKLTDFGHVYGITRRGFGDSSHPDSGYTQQRLADDILQVLDSLKIAKPVLVGHSMAGGELTTLGAEHSDRLAGLVYMAAGENPYYIPSYRALLDKLPSTMAMRKPPEPPAEAYKSFRAYRDWQMRTLGFAFPESELRNMFETGPDGSIGRYRTPNNVFDAIHDGEQKRDYSKISVPMLGLYPFPPSEDDHLQRYTLWQPKNAQERAAVREVYDADASYIHSYEKGLQAGLGGARVIELPGANHYVFLTNEADVLRELQAFVVGRH
jgi:non-heme chloroperoxidase